MSTRFPTIEAYVTAWRALSRDEQDAVRALRDERRQALIAQGNILVSVTLEEILAELV